MTGKVHPVEISRPNCGCEPMPYTPILREDGPLQRKWAMI